MRFSLMFCQSLSTLKNRIGQPPKNILSEQLSNLLNLLGVAQYQEKRRNAVSKHFPKLAYVVSDVVLYICNSSFAVNKMWFDWSRPLLSHRIISKKKKKPNQIFALECFLHEESKTNGFGICSNN